MKIASFTAAELDAADELFELMSAGVDFLAAGPASTVAAKEFPRGEFAPQAGVGPAY
jgi:hypothetical protein